MRTVLASAICVALVLSLIGVSLRFPEPSYACSCIKPGPPSEALEESAMVFEGKVVSVRKYERLDGTWSGADPVVVEFDVRTIWKGYDYQTFYLTTGRSDASCGFRFVEGEEYLVYTRNAVTVNICSRTSSLSEAENDLEALGEGQSPTPGTVGPIPTVPIDLIEVVPSTDSQVKPTAVASASEARDDASSEVPSPVAEAAVPTPGTSQSVIEATPKPSISESVLKATPSPESLADQLENAEPKITEEPTGGGCNAGLSNTEVSFAGLVAGLFFLGFRGRRFRL